jgi:hypothetical protein
MSAIFQAECSEIDKTEFVAIMFLLLGLVEQGRKGGSLLII